MVNYHMPVDFGALLKKERLPAVSLRTSIREHIFLILLTQHGEWRYDYNFHCLLWEKDFEPTGKIEDWIGEVQEDIRNSILQYETRLKVGVIEVQRDELKEKNEQGNVLRIRNRLNIKVKGTIVQNDESFEEDFLMFFGPITVV